MLLSSVALACLLHAVAPQAADGTTMQLSTELDSFLITDSTRPPRADPTARQGATKRGGLVAPCSDNPALLCKDGRVFPVRGINYFPASFRLGEPNVFSAPEIDSDLSLLSSRGINTLVTQGGQWRNGTDPRYQLLRKFLDLAQRHNLMVLVFLEGCVGWLGDPVWQPTDTCDGAIVGAGLADHPAVLGYDTWWEAHVGTEAGAGNPPRHALLQKYQAWLTDRFGSLASAAKCFGGRVPQLPSDEALCAAANASTNASDFTDAILFRRFVRDRLNSLYSQRLQALRKLDPHHLLGARSGYGGNGARFACAAMPIDVRYTGARLFDFASPEGYGYDQSPPTNFTEMDVDIGFTLAYAGAYEKPVWMLEFGASTCGSTQTPGCTALDQPKGVLQHQADMMQGFVRSIAAHGGVGFFPWWFVGQRPKNQHDSEHSDFGLLYDSDAFPSAVDSSVHPVKTRIGMMSVCTADPTVHLIIASDSTQPGKSFSCPVGTLPIGSFKPAPAVSNATVAAIGSDGRTIRDGWLSLCSNSSRWGGGEGATGLYVYQDGAEPTLQPDACPVNTTAAGRFMPQQSVVGATATAIDQRSIQFGWMQLCVADSELLLVTTAVNSLNRSRQCPVGYEERGSFQPNTLPLEKPAFSAFTTAAQEFEPREHAPNATADIEVDPDRAAGRWQVFADGRAAFGAALGTHGTTAGLRLKTPCSGTISTDATARLCLGFEDRRLPTGCAQCASKCLDATIDFLMVSVDNKTTWTRANGTAQEPTRVQLARGASLWVAAQVGNEAEAGWVTRQRPANGGSTNSTGIVFLGCNENLGRVSCRLPVEWSDVVRWRETVRVLPQQVPVPQRQAGAGLPPQQIVLQMVAEGVSWFGSAVWLSVVHGS